MTNINGSSTKEISPTNRLWGMANVGAHLRITEWAGGGWVYVATWVTVMYQLCFLFGLTCVVKK